jgi:subtilisin family serine protease
MRIGQVWDEGARGQGVTVAVIDTGVQADRPELEGVVLPGYLSADSDAEKSHGTHMAMLIAAQGGGSGLTGIAPDVKIMPLSKGVPDERSLPAAVDAGAKIISLSVGSGRECLDSEAEAVRYALSKGAIVVAGVGNWGDSDTSPGVIAPASCPGVVAVGAVDSSGAVWSGSQQGPEIGLVAPGDHMVWVDNFGRKGHTEGTSNSTALVSGVMALVWSAHPELTNRQVVARVLATAKDIEAPGRDEASGFGVARPYQAVTEDVLLDAPNPIFDAAGITEGAIPGAAEPSTSPLPAAGEGSDSGEASGSGGGPVVWVAAGIGGLVLVAVIVTVAVAARRRSGAPPSTGEDTTTFSGLL